MHLLLGLVAETVLSSILRSLCFQCLERALFTQDHMSVDEASTRSVMHDRKFVCAAIRRNSAAANLARKRELVNHDSSTHGETFASCAHAGLVDETVTIQEHTSAHEAIRFL